MAKISFTFLVNRFLRSSKSLTLDREKNQLARGLAEHSGDECSIADPDECPAAKTNSSDDPTKETHMASVSAGVGDSAGNSPPEAMLWSGWNVAGASVAGSAHEDNDDPCQDAYAVTYRRDGWAIAVVCDGAGSAACGGQAANYQSKIILQALRSYFSEEAPNTPIEIHFEEIVRGVVASVRAVILENAALEDKQPDDYLATLVGVIACRKGGAFFHIGDGAAVACQVGEPENCIVSCPDNGEYADETYFLVEDSWSKHLRVKTFDGSYDVIFLMSDGCTPYMLDESQTTVDVGTFSAIHRFMIARERNLREQALEEFLASREVVDITSDDKTLVWLFDSRDPSSDDSRRLEDPPS